MCGVISEEMLMLMKEILIGDHLFVLLDRHLDPVQDLLTCPPGEADDEGNIKLSRCSSPSMNWLDATYYCFCFFESFDDTVGDNLV